MSSDRSFPARAALVAAVLITSLGMAAPGLGYALFGGPADGQYRLPALYPPQWMFWAIWLFLYPTIGIATAYVWRARRADAYADTALLIFGLHLLVNISWVPIVQASHRPLTVSVVMDFIVDIASIIAAYAYGRVSQTAVVWLLPYLGWEIFTTTIKVWRLMINT